MTIVIGAFEAQSIAIALEKEIKPPRPLTHDLFKSFSDRFDITVKQVIIHKLVDGVFYSSLICERDKIEEIIDARTSDAIALALRFKAAIFTYEAILEKAGIILSHEKTMDPNPISENIISSNLESLHDKDDLVNLSGISLETLNEMLIEAVKNEDYESAVRIRDEISKR